MADIFSEEGVKKIHRKVVEVLETIGVELQHEDARKLLISAGARPDGKRILFPEKLLESSLENNISSFTVYDKNGNPKMELDPASRKTYFGPGGDALYQIDLDNDIQRPSKLQDVTENIKILEEMDHFDFLMSTALPAEIDGSNVYGTVFKEVMRNSTKPVVITAGSIEDLSEICSLAGQELGINALRKKPYLISYIELISPLNLPSESVEKLIISLESGLPICFASGANSGLGAPVTLEGAVIQGMAESLAGYILTKLYKPDATYIVGNNSSAMHPKTMQLRYGCPEWIRTVRMYAELGRFYRMPSWGIGGCTDAKEMDHIAAWETQQGIASAIESGITLAHDVGFYNYGYTYDKKMLILADEIIKRERYLRKDANLTDECIDSSIEAMKKVIYDREMFLTLPHTSEYFRESLYLPPKTDIENLKKKVRKILAEKK
ncbi:MAG: trimethylamine methyltransferase family protein [Victivallales bacterium]|nr:trimethylamine methyltransferase family protein [Victivallales bacterium]